MGHNNVSSEYLLNRMEGVLDGREMSSHHRRSVGGAGTDAFVRYLVLLLLEFSVVFIMEFRQFRHSA